MRMPTILSASLLVVAAAGGGPAVHAQAGADLEVEKRAIREVLERQTRLFWVGDFDSYMQVWAHEPHVVRMSPTGQRIVGWDAVADSYRNWIGSARRPVRDYTLEPSDWHIHVNGNAAWVINNQRETGRVEGESYATEMWNVRLLEKRDGQWKVVFILPRSLTAGTVSQTGSEVWDRSVAYHDPGGRWADFQGKVHIVTTRATGRLSQEELELRNPDDFYQSTRLEGDVRAAKGVRKGECFRSVNENADPTEEEVTKYVISCESARFMREHHAQHFGFPMELRSSGMTVEPEVARTELMGRPVYALRFTGKEGAVKHPYYSGTWTIFVDPGSYAMRGVRVQNESVRDFLCVYEGELEVGGVRMPQVKTCYRDGKFYLTDTFTHPAGR